jgi:NADH-quinone oxidoreductase subunit L
MTFYGKEKGDKHTHEHAHESPMVMLIPLGVLSLGAVFAGMIWYGVFFGDHAKVTSWFGMPHHEETVEGAGDEEHAEDVAALQEAADAVNAEHTPAADDHAAATEEHAASDDYGTGHDMAPQGAIFMAPDNTVLDDAHHAPTWVKISPFIAMVIGFVTAYWFYIVNPALPAKLAENQRPLYNFLLNKWYFDEIYDFLFVNSAKKLGRILWKQGDEAIIKGGINGLAMGIVPWVTRLAGRAQSGYIFTYAFAMVIGIALLITWMTVSGGAH